MHPLSYATLEQIVQASVHGVLLLEAQGHRVRIRFANPAYERQSGYALRELAGHAWSTHFAGESVLSDPDELNRFIMRGLPAVQTLTFLRKDGVEWESQVHLSRVGGISGDASLILAQHVIAGVEVEVAPAEDSQPASRGPKLAAVAPPQPAARIPGMLSSDQFGALLSRDLAIARRHERPVTLILFEIGEFEVYRETFGILAAESCARMIGTQIVGTFSRAIDLRARLDGSTFAVAVHEQSEAQSERMAEIVCDKVGRLSLPNPRGHSSRHIEVRSASASSAAGEPDAADLIARAFRLLDGDDAVSPREALHAAG